MNARPTVQDGRVTADHNWKQQQAAARAREGALDFIEQFTRERGYPPTRAEIAEALGISKTSAARAINSLISEKVLTEGDGPRTLQISF